MALSHSPRIITDGLVLCLDAGNTKGYDKFENLMTNSQLGTTILNNGGGVTLTTDTTITNPFGGSDGVLKCVHTTNTPGYFRRGQNMSLTAGVTYTFSFYFKNGTVSNPYGQNRLNIGTLASTYTPTFQDLGQSLDTNIPVGNGWYRQVFTFTPSYTQTYQVDFNQAVNQTLLGTYYLYGFQLEIGSSVTDYYATTSTAKIRGTTWGDLSGNGNNGTLVNGPTYSSSNGGSISFDGSNDEVICTNNASVQITVGTISAWFNANNGNSGYNGIITKQSAWGLFVKDNILLAYDWGGGGDRSTGINVGNSTWNYVAMSFTETVGTPSNNAIIYLNASPVLTTTVKHSNHNVTVQVGEANAAQHFGGFIASASVYNRVLTASEIQQNFNALRGRFGI